MSSSTRRVHQGLPSNPRSRLAGGLSPSQSEERHPPRTMPVPRSRDLRIQREQVPDTNKGAFRSRQQGDYHATRNVRHSGDSGSSSESPSFWDRGNASQRSSRTTIQSDEGMQYAELPQDTHSDDRDLNRPYPAVKDAGHVWDRVTEAANVFTQEVSKVWATGLGGERGDDEEAESHLTRVMRAYHLSKARTPAELPNWLFSERERGQGGLLRLDPPNDVDQVKTEPAKPAQRRVNRPPIYQDGTAASLGHSKTISLGQAKVSGSDRLKQMRELRRNATRI